MIRIAVISATKISIEPVETAVRDMEGIQVFHLLDEGMSYLGKSEGRISERNLQRMINLIHQAEDLGVDGIMLSCTIFSPYIDLLKSVSSVPLVAADIGVFEYAASKYRKIGAVVTFEPTLESVAAVVERCRKNINPELEVDIRFAKGAFEAVAAGNDALHNRLIYETACSFAADTEAVVLSQMSHMRAMPLFENFSVPVLTSPPVTLKLLSDMIMQKK